MSGCSFVQICFVCHLVLWPAATRVRSQGGWQKHSISQVRRVRSQLLLKSCGPSPIPSGPQGGAGPQDWDWVLTLIAGSIHRQGKPHIWALLRDLQPTQQPAVANHRFVQAFSAHGNRKRSGAGDRAGGPARGFAAPCHWTWLSLRGQGEFPCSPGKRFWGPRYPGKLILGEASTEEGVTPEWCLLSKGRQTSSGDICIPSCSKPHDTTYCTVPGPKSLSLERFCHPYKGRVRWKKPAHYKLSLKEGMRMGQGTPLQPQHPSKEL